MNLRLMLPRPRQEQERIMPAQGLIIDARSNSEVFINAVFLYHLSVCLSHLMLSSVAPAQGYRLSNHFPTSKPVSKIHPGSLLTNMWVSVKYP